MQSRWIILATMMMAFTACGDGTWSRTATEPQPLQPVDISLQKPIVADPTQPVASGNTPAAADVAALAALNAHFDPLRDPEKDLQTAVVEANRGNRNIVLNIGGEWCTWCHIMDDFIASNSELRRFRDAHFVWVKVNYSTENENKAFLARYPTISEYPHLFVLDANGVLVHSQLIDELKQDQHFDTEKFQEFLSAWLPSGNELPEEFLSGG